MNDDTSREKSRSLKFNTSDSITHTSLSSRPRSCQAKYESNSSGLILDRGPNSFAPCTAASIASAHPDRGLPSSQDRTSTKLNLHLALFTRKVSLRPKIAICFKSSVNFRHELQERTKSDCSGPSRSREKGLRIWWTVRFSIVHDLTQSKKQIDVTIVSVPPRSHSVCQFSCIASPFSAMIYPAARHLHSFIRQLCPSTT